MNAFIKKHEINYIRKCLGDLDAAFRGCLDPKIIATTKGVQFEGIVSIFPTLSEEEKNLLAFDKINNSKDIKEYTELISEYVYGMKEFTNAQISRLFKKEKKLKLPGKDSQDSPLVYLGWIDDATRKLFVAYNMNDKPIGMACRITVNNSHNKHMCALCNHIGGKDEVTFVSPVCKSDNSEEGNYRSIGFEICLDSTSCNERIVNVSKLEEILRDVNNIK
jgi:hypothetical protein